MDHNKFILFVAEYLEKCSLDDLKKHPVNIESRIQYFKEKFEKEGKPDVHKTGKLLYFKASKRRH